MSSARIASDGAVTVLDGRSEPDEIISTPDIEDPVKLARRLAVMSKDIAGLRREWRPSLLDFEDTPVSTAGAAVQLQHSFGGRVRWWVVDWECASNAAPILRKDDSSTTSDTLVLKSYVAGTATIRVESAG